MPLTDYETEEALVARALKEAAHLRGAGMAPTTVQAGRRVIPNFAGTYDRFLQQSAGNRMEDEAVARMRQLGQQQGSDIERLQQDIGTPAEGLTPEQENQRQMNLGMQMMMLPRARAVGTQFVNSGVGFPEKQAQLKAQQDLMREQQAARLAAQQQMAQDKLEAQKQRDADNRALRMTLAQMAQSNKGANSDLDRQIKEARLEALRSKEGVGPKLSNAKQKAVDDSDVLISHIDNALESINQNPNALGLKTMLPDIITQRTNPEGVSTRAAVGGLSAEKVHQLSGAAVSPAEFARLRPYLPSAGDDAETAKKKLQNLRAEMVRIKEIHLKGPAYVGQPSAPAAPSGPEEWVRDPNTGKLVRK